MDLIRILAVRKDNDMLVNLTPHPMHIFDADTPDRVNPDTVTPITVIAPSMRIARLGHTAIGYDNGIDLGIPVHRVIYGRLDGQPDALPAPCEGTWYIVSTLVALAHPHRHDLLVPYGHIRDLDGHVIGSTGFARPVTSDR